MVITVPAIPSERLWALGSKLYVSNMQRMLNKTLTGFMQSLSQIDERKPLLAKCSVVIYGHKNWFLSTMELTFLLDVPMKLNKRGCFPTADW